MAPSSTQIICEMKNLSRLRTAAFFLEIQLKKKK